MWNGQGAPGQTCAISLSCNIGRRFICAPHTPLPPHMALYTPEEHLEGSFLWTYPSPRTVSQLRQIILSLGWSLLLLWAGITFSCPGAWKAAQSCVHPIRLPSSPALRKFFTMSPPTSLVTLHTLSPTRWAEEAWGTFAFSFVLQTSSGVQLLRGTVVASV